VELSVDSVGNGTTGREVDTDVGTRVSTDISTRVDTDVDTRVIQRWRTSLLNSKSIAFQDQDWTVKGSHLDSSVLGESN
jgi:hypothetical protein